MDMLLADSDCNDLMLAGVIEQAVPRSITLEILSGPQALLTLCVENFTIILKQVTLG